MDNMEKVEKLNSASYLYEGSSNAEKGESIGSQEIETGIVKETEVKRGLKLRHVSMIALGGTIGTGLFIGTKTPLAIAGPVNTLIAYLFMGSIAYSVTQSLGELATHTPISGSFCTFNTRYISKAIGFSTSWCYWFSWAITFAIELSIVGQIIQYWTHALNFMVKLNFGSL
ncbi:unnamed protein product [[Candida] boidinii]|nr:unnamed protein product [[Candida] boidinii]GMF84787.1 unnamed protein product [[Candida] boidinii]